MANKFRIIFGFPGIGKSKLHQMMPASTTDCDSATYIKNEQWPQNYLDHLKVLQATGTIVLASIHRELLAAALISETRMLIIYPAIGLKDVYLKRYAERGDSEEFIKQMDDNWDDYIADICTVPEHLRLELRDGTQALNKFIQDPMFLQQLKY